jgi:hypothetical protein
MDWLEVPNKDPVILPLTDRLPVIDADPVTTKDPETSNVSALEESIVPVLPEILKPLALTYVSTDMELKLAAEPDETTFFHDGIFSSNYGWLQYILPTSTFVANKKILFLETN